MNSLYTIKMLEDLEEIDLEVVTMKESLEYLFMNNKFLTVQILCPEYMCVGKYADDEVVWDRFYYDEC